MRVEKKASKTLDKIDRKILTILRFMQIPILGIA